MNALPAALQTWLTAPGSLTARLRAHGTVTVQVLSQGRQRLLTQEYHTLNTTIGYVREVVLKVNGRAAIWARSSTPLRAVKGPWRAIKGLGARPLAELLFEGHGVQRGPLYAARPPRQGALRRHLERQWALAADDQAGAQPIWLRWSVFRHQGQPLQVMECFAPWVQTLSIQAQTHRHIRVPAQRP